MSSAIDIQNPPPTEWICVTNVWISAMLPGFVRGYQIGVVLYFNTYFRYYSAYIGVPSKYFTDEKNAAFQTEREQSEDIKDYGSKMFFSDAAGYFTNTRLYEELTDTEFNSTNFRR